MTPTTIQNIVVEPLTIPLLEPFTIATGSVASANVPITLTLRMGVLGMANARHLLPALANCRRPRWQRLRAALIC